VSFAFIKQGSFVLCKDLECSSQAWVFYIQVNKVGSVPARNKRPRLRDQCPSGMWQDSELQTLHSTKSAMHSRDHCSSTFVPDCA
jgi:hypothetical protein